MFSLNITGLWVCDIWNLEGAASFPNSKYASGKMFLPLLLLSRIEVPYVHAAYCYRPSSVVRRSVCPIDLPFGLWIRVGRSKHKFNRIRQVLPICRQGRVTGASRPIRSNHLSAAAMRPYVKLLWPLVVMIIPLSAPVDNIWAMMTVQQRIRENTIKLFCAVLCSKTHTYKQFLQLTIGIGFFDLGFFCVFFAILFVCCFLLLC